MCAPKNRRCKKKKASMEKNTPPGNAIFKPNNAGCAQTWAFLKVGGRGAPWLVCFYACLLFLESMTVLAPRNKPKQGAPTVQQ